MARELLKGNVAMAEAAIRAGLEAYFGYPDHAPDGTAGMDVQAYARTGASFFTGRDLRSQLSTWCTAQPAPAPG